MRPAVPSAVSVGKVKDGHALSLKDNSIIPYITQLQEMGVASAKIEGRMKRPEYVSAAVRACKEQRDNGFISDDTAEILKNVFHEQDLPTVIIQAKQAMKCSDTAEKTMLYRQTKNFFKNPSKLQGRAFRYCNKRYIHGKNRRKSDPCNHGRNA